MYVSDFYHTNEKLQRKLEALYALRVDKNLILGFRPEYLDLLAAFGNPHLNLPPTIHVAGTNGKGSTIAFMRAMLEEAGHSVHVYSSPHLVRFNERIVLAGREIDDNTLESLIDEALAANNGRAVSFFEITTAIAFKAFADTPADYLLLETGLGGRLDCTNVIEKPIATVITNIGLDHQEFLGDTIEDIAREKAGIIKAGVPYFVGDMDVRALKVIEGGAKKKNAPLHRHCEEGVSPTRQSMGLKMDCFASLAMTGGYQRYNRNLAVSVMRQLNISENAIQQGIQNFHWPARLQKIHTDEHWDIYLDGGHNADAARVLVAQIKMWKNSGGGVHLIIGMMGHKDHIAFIVPLARAANSVTFVDIPNEPQAMRAAELYELYCHSDRLKGAEESETIIRSLDCARDDSTHNKAITRIKQNHRGGIILICGSLYLAGHVLKSEGLM
jgi:dihydrofolate synthase/folylpolyglutamate synthase